MNEKRKTVSKDLNSQKILKEVQATSDEASRLLADLDSSSNNKTDNAGRSNEQKSKGGPHQPYKYQPNREEFSDFPGNRIGGVVSFFILSLFILIPLINSTNTSSPSESTFKTSTANPSRIARYKSGPTAKAEMMGVNLTVKTNSNGHIAYEARWADGYKSSYVFWRSGQAEIFSKNKAGFMERTNARFKRASNGDCIITADTNAVTTFPSFTPTLN